MNPVSASPQAKVRQFLPADLRISSWADLEPFLLKLEQEVPAGVPEMEAWLHHISEVECALYEELAWRYIRMTCNTADAQLRDAYNQFVEHVLSPFKALENRLRRKLNDSPVAARLDQKKYRIPLRTIRNSLEIFREENIPLQTRIQTLSHRYGEIAGEMEVEHEGRKLTLQQAATLLEDRDRSLRETIWRKSSSRRMQDKQALDTLYDELIRMRQEVARNAGFDNFRDYCFKDLGRFDYTPDDCQRFHDAVEKEIRPIYESFLRDRQQKLGQERLRPWDLSVDIFGGNPLRPFRNADELLNGTRAIFSRLHPELGNLVSTMESRGFLDLESRKGKAPGGYNYPLPETGLSFIFMNAAGNLGDLTTMVHEVGHAAHAHQMQTLELNEFRNTPSEVAELASMSMELLTMDHWDVFFPADADLRRARYEQISRTITILPWIATVDAFQHWVYQNPSHSAEVRHRKWAELYARFHGDVVDWTGLENEKGALWQKQIHIFEVPFYYIEYGIAQLGALAMWRNYRQDPSGTMKRYLAALEMGYTKTIPEIYSEAGIRFDFSHEYIRELAEFVVGQLKEITR